MIRFLATQHAALYTSSNKQQATLTAYDMNDDMRMQEDDAQADNRNNRSSRRGGMEMPDDEPALDGYAR